MPARSTRFAATFIGSPAINLVKGGLDAGGRFRGGGLDVTLPPGVLDTALSPRPVELGVRPESARIARDFEPHQTIAVDYVKPTGADLYVNGNAGGQPIVARVDRAEG